MHAANNINLQQLRVEAEGHGWFCSSQHRTSALTIMLTDPVPEHQKSSHDQVCPGSLAEDLMTVSSTACGNFYIKNEPSQMLMGLPYHAMAV